MVALALQMRAYSTSIVLIIQPSRSVRILNPSSVASSSRAQVVELPVSQDGYRGMWYAHSRRQKSTDSRLDIFLGKIVVL